MNSGLQAPPTITFESAKAFGDLWALQELWHTLGFGEMHRCFRSSRLEMDVEALIRTMVFNRLCDPESKLGVLRWLETVSFPGINAEAVMHQKLQRSMDALMDHQEAIQKLLAQCIRPAVDCRMVNRHTALQHHLVEITVTQRVRCIPANTHQNDFLRKSHPFHIQYFVKNQAIDIRSEYTIPSCPCLNVTEPVLFANATEPLCRHTVSMVTLLNKH